jgi:transcriptional regulator with XRE-family HTH domain
MQATEVDPETVAAPTLDGYLRHLREREALRRGAKKVSRERVAREVPMSSGYLEKLENNHQDRRERPSLPILQGLGRVYGLSRDEWRHLCDLACQGSFCDLAGQRQLWDLGGCGLSSELPDPAAFQDALTPMMRAELRGDCVGDLVAYFDVRWILLDANDAYRTIFAEHKVGMSMVEWYFGQEAKNRLPDWHTEVFNAVAWWRGVMGKFHRCEWATDLHRRLWRHPEFVEFWRAGEVLINWREQESQLHARWPDGALRTLNVEHWTKVQDMPIIRFHARPGPFTGPGHLLG